MKFPIYFNDETFIIVRRESFHRVAEIISPSDFHRDNLFRVIMFHLNSDFPFFQSIHHLSPF